MSHRSLFQLPNAPQAGLIVSGICSVQQELVYEMPIYLYDCRLFEKNEIGFLTYIQPRGTLLNATIGRYCSIAEGVFIGPWEHPTDRISTHHFAFNGFADQHELALTPFEQFGAYQRIVDRENAISSSEAPRTVVGNDVWIGRNVTICQGVRVGDGAVIGAHAVVTKDVAPYTIVAGVPARPIRSRFPEHVIAKLLELQWWNYDLRGLRERVDYRDIDRFIKVLRDCIASGEARRLDAVKVIAENTGQQGQFRIK